jgi:hypothetical protein
MMTSEPLDLIASPSRSGPRSYRLHGWLSSAILHGVLLAGLLAATWQPWWFGGGGSGSGQTIQVTAVVADEEPPEPAAPEVRIISDPSEVTPNLLREAIDRSFEETRQRSDAENLARLDELTARLNRVTEAGSVEAMAGTVHSLLGTAPRADRPAAEPVAGDFDYNTAQFYDVERFANDDGSYRYVCVLVDAAGRTVQAEMNPADGQRVYETMQRIKANPLLEQVYRRIAMPLFDQILGGLKQAESLQPSAVSQEPPAPPDGEAPGAEPPPKGRDIAERRTPG